MPVLKTHLDMPSAPFDLEVYCKAIQLRLICSNSVPWANECWRLSRIPELDPRTDHNVLRSLAAPEEWLPRLSCKILETIARQGRLLGIIRFDSIAQKWEPCNATLPFTGKNSKSIQNQFVQELLRPRWGIPSVSNLNTIRALQPRVRRWKATVVDTSWTDTTTVLKLLHESKGTISPNVAFAYLQSICYGWCTDKRFKTYPVRACVWGCHAADGTEDFYHYYACPVLEAALRSLGLDFVPPGDSLLRHLLILDGTTQCQLRMAFLHAAMTSVHLLRAGYSRVQIDNRGRHIRSIFRDTLSRNCKLKSAYILMRQQRG